MAETRSGIIAHHDEWQPHVRVVLGAEEDGLQMVIPHAHVVSFSPEALKQLAEAVSKVFWDTPHCSYCS